MHRKDAWILAPCLFLLLSGARLFAGGGPENVFLVVNSAVPDSLTIANHFVEWRKIPVGSVFYIDWKDPPFDTDAHTFRDRILKPVLDEIKRRQLSSQIDYIIYSSGFPYRIDFTSDLGDAISEHPKASITGLTYLYDYTMREAVKDLVLERRNARQAAVTANLYARNLFDGAESRSHGFRARYGIDILGNRVKQGDGGKQYYLSMMLAHTRGVQNNTIVEVMKYLKNGVKADGTQPKGTIYLVRNDNIRSTVRHDSFEEVADALISLGVNAEVIEGKSDVKFALPVNKDDVQGAVVGCYRTAWGITNSKILPGAIVENYTSYGGVMSGANTNVQSLLSNFLKFGAVASSGAVAEPFAIAAKFPHPRIHVHYARGCSVAESFYQSVIAPYQLLIVGDPLCQPWAVPPTVKLTGLKTQEPVSGVIELQASAKSQGGHEIRNFEVFVDGVLASRNLVEQPIRIDTNRLANGYHELRVVAIEDTPIETQGRVITGFVSVNLPKTNDQVGTASVGDDPPPAVGITTSLIPRDGVLRLGQPGFISVYSKGAREIRIYRGRDLIGSTKGPSGRILVNPAKIGGGPASLRPVAFPKDRSQKPVFGFPLKVNVVFSLN